MSVTPLNLSTTLKYKKQDSSYVDFYIGHKEEKYVNPKILVLSFLATFLTFGKQLVGAGIGDLGHRLFPGTHLLTPNKYSQSFISPVY